MKITHALSEKEKSELDRLLWDVLWKPLGFPRGVRRELSLGGHEIELAAVADGAVVGGLVASKLCENVFEIRHLAVSPGFQGRSAGRRLVEKLMELLRERNATKIYAWVRNTSAGFFTALGFKPTGERLEHPDFGRHGITFQQMCIEINE